MKRFISALALSVTLLLGVVASGNDDRQQVVESFAKHVSSLEQVEQQVIDSARQKIAELQSDSIADAVTEALFLVYPGYSSAIEASDGDNPLTAMQALAEFSKSEDPFLAADASFYLARMLMNDERYEEALPVLAQLSGPYRDSTVHSNTVKYFVGVAHAGMLQNDLAVNSFKKFLEESPQAPERLRVSAWRQVQQLMSIKEGQMTDVHQRMDFSRRRLRLAESGEKTQEEQDKIVKMLTKLIKEQEKKECSSCNSNKPNTKKQQQQQPKQQQQAKKKPKPNKSQQGGSSSNPNGEVVDKTHDNSPASPWSRLRDRSRDPANNAIKDKLPPRYRDIVEKYYEKANGRGSRN